MFFERKGENQENKEEKLNWKKHGDFSKKLNLGPGTTLKRSVEYTNTKNDTLWIGGTEDNEIRLNFKTKTKDVLRKVISKCRELKLNINTSDHDILEGGYVSFHTMDKKSVAEFIKIVDSVVPLGKEIKKEIFNTLSIKLIPNEEDFYNELHALVNTSKFGEALAKVKEVEDDDAIWKLAQICETQGKLQEAFQCYANILPDNPHYKTANEQAAHLLMRIESVSKASAGPGAGSLDDDENSENKDEDRSGIETRFNLMLNAEPTPENQRWIDSTFHQLSGGEGLTPSITNVRPDVSTLLTLAKQMEILRQENARLKEKLQSNKAASVSDSDNRSAGPGAGR